MKAQFKPRPESKSIRPEVRPLTSRHINKEQASITFKQAKEEQASSSFQKAIDLYLRASIYDPNYYQAYCNIGSCYRSLGQYMEARRFYKKSISIKKDDAISHYNLANTQRIIGDLQSAVEHYLFVISLKEEKKVEIGTLYLNSLINLGICYKNKDLYDKANQCYEKALKIDPKEETALYNYGMSIVNSLKKMNILIFQSVAKEKAQKALQIFSKYLEIYKVNQMVQFQSLRMTCMVDKSGQNITKAIQALKKMLKAPNCEIRNQINLQLGYLSGLLKDYDKAALHYQKSMSGFNKRKESQSIREENIYDNSKGFTNKPILHNKANTLTEEQGLRMIEDGVIQQLKQELEKLQQSNQIKHVLKLVLQLYYLDKEEGNLQIAIDIYQKYFRKNGAEIANQLVSIEGHKAIGKLLAYQKKYKESIAHFEYISTRINSKEQKSKVHSSLANDYEAIGDKTKALQQYKIALQSQPQNYELIYNMGCLFHDQESYTEALSYFQKFLELIQKDFTVDLAKKSIYVADCLVTMAQCKYQIQINKLVLYEPYLKAWLALKQLETDAEGFEFEDSKILAFYLIWADILQQKLESCQDRHSQQFISTKQKLLQVYVSLLQNSACPDRDAILNNCATIYYEQKLYVNALANFNLVSSPQKISCNNLALTYLHLREHYMANRLIYIAYQQESDDNIEQFNWQVFNWIYGLSQEGKLNEKFKNCSDEALASRLEYGIMLIDAVTAKLNELPQHYNLSQKDNIVKNALTSQFLGQYYDQSQHNKLKALIKVLNVRKSIVNDYADSNYVSICLTKSKDLEQQFNAFLKKMSNQGDNLTQTVVQLLINLYIFTNRDHSSALKSVIRKHHKQQSLRLAINLDRRVTITPELVTKTFSKQSGIRDVGDLIQHIINWQSQFQSKMVVLIKNIQKYYYKSKLKKPLQIQYHFPRHLEWSQCTPTFMKILYFVFQGMKIEPSLELKGKKLSDIKYRIFAQMQQGVIKKINGKDEIKVIIGDKFMPVTVFTYFESKKDCINFLKELQKQSSEKQEIQIGKDFNEVVVNISGILRLSCVWEEPSIFTTSIKSYTQTSIPIEVQAGISLQSELYILKQSSPRNKEMLEQVELFTE